MPATSLKQKKFMDAAAHNPDFAKAAGVPQKVAKDFSESSKGLKFGKGQESRADLQKVNEPKTRQGKTELFKKGGQIMATKKSAGNGITKAKMGSVKTAAPSVNGVATKGKTKGTQIKMKASGKPLGMCGGGKVGKK